MRHRVLFATCVAALLATPVAHRAATAADGTPSAPEARIAQGLSDRALEASPLMVVGNHLAWAGDPALLDGDWLALACDESCALLPARVVATPPDDAAGTPRMLAFSVDGADATTVRAWFAVDSQWPWLRAGKVAHYRFGAREATPGSFEIAVDTPVAAGAQLVPMLDGLPPAASPVDEHPMAVYLQLRESGKRQLLLGHLEVCADVPLADYLHWAGDLDRDGRTDYLVRFGDRGGEMHLYLSSQAPSGALVGLGARPPAPASDAPECDY